MSDRTPVYYRRFLILLTAFEVCCYGAIAWQVWHPPADPLSPIRWVCTLALLHVLNGMVTHTQREWRRSKQLERPES